MHRRFGSFLAVLLVTTCSARAIGPTTKANDDSCDIAILPAATLLLPYFEVDIGDAANQTTLLTVTNVVNVAQIARVTLWTDRSFPVMSFNLYLTGYDSESISLYDIIANGIIGYGLPMGSSKSPVGDYSDPNAEHDAACADLPVRIPADFVRRMQDAFTLGRSSTCTTIGSIGSIHANAVGYLTVDVVGNCSSNIPTDPEYFTTDIRYDNVLIGDYQQVSVREKHAQVNPMVHIRAIPEGGTPSSRAADPANYGNRFSQTFYGRYQSESRPSSDARQPLPSRFAVRWINGGFAAMGTSFKIWRQSTTGSMTCDALEKNGQMLVGDSVAFDSRENAEGLVPDDCSVTTCFPAPTPTLPATSLAAIDNLEAFPQSIISTTINGWVYLNLDDGDVANGAHQSWVTVSMRASGDFSGDMDGAALGNGCSPAVGPAEQSEDGSVVIGPSPNGEAQP